MLLRNPASRSTAVFASAILCLACDGPESTTPGAAESAAIAGTLERMVRLAYDFSRDSVVDRIMALYPESGPVISASGGRISTSRDSLEADIRGFWENVGRNMKEAQWEWVETHVEVLSPDAAVLTATYRVPHLTPEGVPHTIAGAWTAVFERRDERWVIVHEHLSDAPASATPP